jgi:hypothetical protein
VKAFLNPWILLGLLVLLGATAAGSYVRGRHDENTAMLAAQAKQRTLDEVIEAGVAKGVSQIKVQNTTIKQKLETLTRENVIYRDCKLDPATRGLLDAALQGKAAQPAGDSVLPAPNPAR